MDKKYVRYTAVVLDDKSRDKLLKIFGEHIPEGWKVFADHMTMNLGKIDNIPENVQYLGMKNIYLSVNDFAVNDYVLAVGVSVTNANIKSSNAKPHITVAVNESMGGKPKMSNDLKDWQTFKRPFLLSGTVTEVE
jgi:hypothetical protein